MYGADTNLNNRIILHKIFLLKNFSQCEWDVINFIIKLLFNLGKIKIINVPIPLNLNTKYGYDGNGFYAYKDEYNIWKSRWSTLFVPATESLTKINFIYTDCNKLQTIEINYNHAQNYPYFEIYLIVNQYIIYTIYGIDKDKIYLYS